MATNKISRPGHVRFYQGLAAVLVGVALNHFGDRLLGVQIELYRGLQGFGGMWIVDMFLLPFIVGFVVALIFGFGGRWLSYFPPLIVRMISYFEIAYFTGVPQGASLLPLGWWGFFVILVVESSAFGGIIGEVIIKGNYGRSPRHKVYKEKSGNNRSDLEA